MRELMPSESAPRYGDWEIYAPGDEAAGGDPRMEPYSPTPGFTFSEEEMDSPYLNRILSAPPGSRERLDLVVRHRSWLADKKAGGFGPGPTAARERHPDYEARPGRPTGRDWADYYRKKYGRENVEWSSLAELRKQFNRDKEKIIQAWVEAHGMPWPTTEDGRPYIPHHDPALSEGGTIWDITPMEPKQHAKIHGGGKTVKPENPFERF
jgi:hypothetical protein